jgi:hypothetical protein
MTGFVRAGVAVPRVRGRPHPPATVAAHLGSGRSVNSTTSGWRTAVVAVSPRVQEDKATMGVTPWASEHHDVINAEVLGQESHLDAGESFAAVVDQRPTSDALPIVTAAGAVRR